MPSNHLVNETSPYLLQHAHNPVEWYPWGEEALSKAKEEDKPILVSIGYSACHWCHVMERESFEDEDTAAIMNEHFINIKIDREERPDLDHIYMDAVQAISGSGGWPLNVFLTPGCKPFYGGTYFPPSRAFNRSSWTEVLQSITRLFKEKREEVEAKAEELTQHIGGNGFLGQAKGVAPLIDAGDMENAFTKDQVESAFNNIMKQADKVWGGFGNAPKFPSTFTINYLLRYYHYYKEDVALKQALLSLDKMIDGGIYDQIGGGFARYSTDREWLAPHFEKMLYDNALITMSLSEAYQITKDEKYRVVVSQTVEFIKRKLMHPDGGFYAALDADSEGEEGKYYVWKYSEIKGLLGEEAELYCEYYDVSLKGNWEGKNILRVLKPLPVFAEERKLSVDEVRSRLDACSAKLLGERRKRIPPGTDDKIMLGWNALMITALCKACSAFGIEEYKQLAISIYDFIMNKLTKETGSYQLYHTYKNGVAKYPAFLDDYATLINAAIHLQEITSDEKYLLDAQKLIQYVIDNFSDEEAQFFYYTSVQQTDIIVRKKEVYDGAVQSGNSLMAYNLIYLSVVFDTKEWKERALGMVNQLLEMVVKYPTSFAGWAALVVGLKNGVNEIAVVGENYSDLRNRLLEHFIPSKVLQSGNNFTHELFPLLKEKNQVEGKTLLYLCKNYQCNAPTADLKGFINKLLI
jgi:uncharacterized protein